MPEIVTVDLPRSRKTGVKIFGSSHHSKHTKSRRKPGIESRQPASRLFQPPETAHLFLSEFKMNCLPNGMHTGIRPPGSMNDDPLSNNPPKHHLQGILHRASMGLTLKSLKSCAIIGDHKTELHCKLQCRISIQPILQDLYGRGPVDQLALFFAVTTRRVKLLGSHRCREAFIPENHLCLRHRRQDGG